MWNRAMNVAYRGKAEVAFMEGAQLCWGCDDPRALALNNERERATVLAYHLAGNVRFKTISDLE